jgi:hypothetical protein
MEADGMMVVMGFMVAKECPLRESMKEALVQADPDNPQFRHRVLSSADPKAYAEVMSMRDKVPIDRWLRMLELVNIKDENWREDFDEATA